MTRTDDNVVNIRRRALAAMVVVLSAGGCNSPTGVYEADIEVRFENTIPSYYWMETGPSRSSARTDWFTIYPNGVKFDTLEAIAPGRRLYVEMSEPAPQAPARWEVSCTLGSTGFAARKVTVRVGVENNIPALQCIGW
ncbi:MAG TPA: hypothetical protein VJR92_00165 [Gemmatimonadaceae bacterium]|nr:hypothetical protein [Gemmatimonadaceae bacterium]